MTRPDFLPSPLLANSSGERLTARQQAWSEQEQQQQQVVAPAPQVSPGGERPHQPAAPEHPRASKATFWAPRELAERRFGGARNRNGKGESGGRRKEKEKTKGEEQERLVSHRWPPADLVLL